MYIFIKILRKKKDYYRYQLKIERKFEIVLKDLYIRN